MLGSSFKRFLGNAIVNFDLSLVDDRGELVSPCSVKVAIAAYLLTNGNQDDLEESNWYAALKAGKKVRVPLRQRIAEHSNNYCICCKEGEAEATSLRGTSRDVGNSNNTYFLMGRKGEDNFADPSVKPHQYRAYHENFQLIMQEVYGLDPEDHLYDQMMRKHYEITGMRYKRDPYYESDEEGLYPETATQSNQPQVQAQPQVQTTQSNPTQPQVTQSNPVQAQTTQSNPTPAQTNQVSQTGSDDQDLQAAEQTADQYISCFVDEGGHVNLGNGAFVFDPVRFGNTMSTMLALSANNEVLTSRLAEKTMRLISEVCLEAVKTCCTAMVDECSAEQAIGLILYSLKLHNLDSALSLLLADEIEPETEPEVGQEPEPEATSTQAATSEDTAAVDPSSELDDFEDEMDEGRPIEFTFIKWAAKAARERACLNNLLVPLKDRQALSLADAVLTQAMREALAKSNEKHTLGAVYLNKLLQKIGAYGIDLGHGKPLRFRERD